MSIQLIILLAIILLTVAVFLLALAVRRKCSVRGRSELPPAETPNAKMRVYVSNSLDGDDWVLAAEGMPTPKRIRAFDYWEERNPNGVVVCETPVRGEFSLRAALAAVESKTGRSK